MRGEANQKLAGYKKHLYLLYPESEQAILECTY